MGEKRQADRLITEFGKTIGIETLALDEENACILGFDDQVVNIQYDDEHHALILFSELGQVPDESAGQVYQELLVANFYREQMGNAALSLNPGSDIVVLILQSPLDGMDIRLFDQMMEKFVNIAVSWTLKIRTLHESPALEPETDSVGQANWINV